VATHGNTVLKAAYETELKRDKAQRLAKFDFDFQNSVRLLEKTVDQGFWLDPKTNKPRSIDELAGVFRDNIATSAILIGDAQMQKEYSGKFERALAEAKINAVTKFVTGEEFSRDAGAGLAMLRTGQVGKMSIIWQEMPQDDKAKVIANFLLADNQRADLMKRKLEDEKRGNEQRSIDLLERIFLLPEGSLTREDLITELTAIPNNGVPIGTLKDLLTPPGAGESNPRVQFNLLQGIYDGTVNTPEQIWSLVGRGLTGKDAVGALKLMTGEGRRDEAELARGLNRLAGINVTGGVVVLDPKGAEFQRLNQLRARAIEIQAAAMREGKVMMPSQVIDQLTREVEQRRNTESAKQARRQLETYEKLDWINGRITADSIPALERKAGSDRGKLQQVQRIKALLKQADGDL
jgi:hypothetical protein